MDSSNKPAQDMKNYSHNAAVEAVSSMNRELQTLYEKYLELGVRSHLLEVDLATQFSPDVVLVLEDLNESCKTCSQAVEELMNVGEISEEHKKNVDDHMQDNV
ncbi:unnamed protein product [Candidula unifasciata]|uniref:Uncharacterized protein n=1 Tax=Candidula unifasciata TaxID=100452 RepID=A0A8S3ZN81_9EUPU|nr:unnamed protein product [Candidula unifasciata]